MPAKSRRPTRAWSSRARAHACPMPRRLRDLREARGTRLRAGCLYRGHRDPGTTKDEAKFPGFLIGEPVFDVLRTAIDAERDKVETSSNVLAAKQWRLTTVGGRNL